MAKGDVTLKFDAQTAAFVAAINQAREKLEASSDAARKFGDSSAKAGDHAESGFKKAGERAKELAIHMTGIASATDLVEKGFEQVVAAGERFFDRMKERAETLLSEIKDVNSALGASGQGTQAPAVRAALKNITLPGGTLVNPEERDALYGGISRAVGNKVSAADKVEATQVALEGRIAQLDMAGAQELGANFAQLARERRAGGAFEGYTTNQLADLAYQVTVNKPGCLSDKDLRFFSRATDKGQALQLLFAAAQSDESARGLATIQNTAAEPLDAGEIANIEKQMKRHPKTATDENRRKVRLFHLQQSEQDVFSAMLNDPTLAPPADRLAIENLREGAKRIPAPRGLLAEIELQQLTADDETKLYYGTLQSKALAAQIKEQGAAQTLEYQNRVGIHQAIFERDHPFLSSIRVNDWVPYAQAATTGGGDGSAQSAAPAPHEQKQLQILSDISAKMDVQAGLSRTTRDTTLSHNADKPGAQ